MNPLIIKTTKLPNYRDVFERMEKESIILASSSEISKIKPYFDNVYDIDTPYTIEIIDTYLKGVKFRLVPNEYCSGEYKFSRVEVNGNKVDPSDDGTYFFKGLSIYDSKAEIQLYAINDDGAIQTNVITFSKKKPSIHLWYSDVTQTTVTFRVNAYYDETTAKPEIATVKMCESTSQVYSLESSATFTEDQAIVKFNDLTPNTNYSDYKGYGPMVYVRYYDGETFRDEMSNGIKTKNIEIQYENEKIGVTDYSCNFKYNDLGDCELKCTDIYIDENKVLSFSQQDPLMEHRFVLTGLEPLSNHDLSYVGTTKDGKNFEIDKRSFKLDEIELETLKPRVVSSTNAIVAASTNISDVETNVGFQWKKYDAPASLAPNEGYAAIYDGQLEGYIKNLQPTSYYNVRAFYKSANEKYYYSDWVTFDPSDFSYFEPTVHTYPVEPSTDGSVNVKGYVLAGTDDITEQGFEYWSAAGGAKAKRMLAEAPAGPVSKIFATGQVMTATLTDLAPSTTYTLRAFVTTVAGVTYGEEQTFTTPADAAGIIGIDSGMSEPEVTGYYDLNGRRHEEPFSGLNIIRYSDGSARKVFFK